MKVHFKDLRSETKLVKRRIHFQNMKTMAVVRTPQKVILSSLNTEKIISFTLISIFIFLLIISIILYNFIGLSWENLFIHGMMILVFVSFFFSLNKISQVSILGDCVIVKKSNSSRIVTPIKAIKKVQHIPLFKFQLYSLEFKLDGHNQKIRFLSTPDKTADIQLLTAHRRIKAA